jgi:hypothetical protein
MGKVKKTETTNLTLKDIVADIKKVARAANVEPSLLKITEYFSNGGLATEWALRKFGGFTQIRTVHFGHEIQKDLASVNDMKSLRKKQLETERKIGDRDLFLRNLDEILKKQPKLDIKPYKVSSKKKTGKKTKRVLNLLLSDLHFGSDLEARETGHNWGKIEESRSFAKIVKNVCSYKDHYRDETKLVVSILGDIIENELHDKSSAAPVHEQVCRAIHLLSQGIARFAENFPEVVVNFAVGNHGRDVSVHNGRATSQKWNALETSIYYAVKKSCSHITNVKFYQPLTPWVVYDALGHKVYATHGDTNLNVGNPGNTISIRSIETQINRLNSSLKDDEKYAVFALGHVHLSLSTQLPNGAFLILNGALVPPNSFAQTFSIMNSPQNQVMWETTEDHAVGDQRFINASGAEKDSSLDEIIKPFTSIED